MAAAAAERVRWLFWAGAAPAVATGVEPGVAPCSDATRRSTKRSVSARSRLSFARCQSSRPPAAHSSATTRTRPIPLDIEAPTGAAETATTAASSKAVVETVRAPVVAEGLAVLGKLRRAGMNAERDPVVLLLAAFHDRLVAVQLLCRNYVVRESRHFCHRQNPPPSIRQAPDLNDEVDRVRNLPPEAGLRALEASKPRQHLEPVKTFARRARVDGAHRTVVASVHGLQHFQHFAAAYLAHDDPVRTHPQRIAQQVSNGHHARAVKTARTAFQPHHVRVIELELGGVFYRHHAL